MRCSDSKNVRVCVLLLVWWWCVGRKNCQKSDHWLSRPPFGSTTGESGACVRPPPFWLRWSAPTAGLFSTSAICDLTGVSFPLTSNFSGERHLITPRITATARFGRDGCPTTTGPHTGRSESIANIDDPRVHGRMPVVSSILRIGCDLAGRARLFIHTSASTPRCASSPLLVRVAVVKESRSERTSTGAATPLLDKTEVTYNRKRFHISGCRAADNGVCNARHKVRTMVNG